MQPSNNARLKCFGSYVPLTNVVCVDTEQNIWKGERVVELGTSPDAMTTLYFSRDYNPEENEFDRMISEKIFPDASIIGFDFVLVPKDKMLFGYDPPSTIIKPFMDAGKRSPFMREP